jgi:hypothetical protein
LPSSSKYFGKIFEKTEKKRFPSNFKILSGKVYRSNQKIDWVALSHTKHVSDCIHLSRFWNYHANKIWIEIRGAKNRDLTK